MTKERLAVITVACICLGLLFMGLFPGTPIEKYPPKNLPEKQLMELIITFHRARQAYDLDTYLSCLSPNGQFMFSGSPMLSKTELTRQLPGFWTDLKSGSMSARSASRESLNGNSLDGDLYDPVILVEDSRARAALKFITPVTRWKTMLFLEFEKKNGLWQISRLEWDMG